MTIVLTSMTVRQALSRAREMLEANAIEDPSLESVLLLTHTLKIDRVQLYTELDNQLNPNQSEQFRQLIERRLKGEPSAYIVGHREFYGLNFCVDSNVLIPRPETELLVEKALEIARQHSLIHIADIGTGCGAIAISLSVKLPEAKIYATDISAAALKVAEANCRKHGVSERICLLEGDMLAPLPEPVDLIVANLPYVSEPDLAKVNTLGFEPSLALNGGPDGLDKIRRLCSQIDGKLRLHSTSSGQAGGSLLLEIGDGQRAAVTAFLHNLYPSAKIESFTDLAGVGRVVRVSL